MGEVFFEKTDEAHPGHPGRDAGFFPQRYAHTNPERIHVRTKRLHRQAV